MITEVAQGLLSFLYRGSLEAIQMSKKPGWKRKKPFVIALRPGLKTISLFGRRPTEKRHLQEYLKIGHTLTSRK